MSLLNVGGGQGGERKEGASERARDGEGKRTAAGEWGGGGAK